ncbi:PIN domain-containing protein [Halococcoides cellulosivorans]|uniref:Ribonuclease VapC n=1 Tax=Halococcoides cellulosivorans TaxID=1679096 RepID=A0A2R4X3L0_9EURY|nr:PIN domain-containing protein [Halococcoides cellulosivorans]AWB28377.1 VapC toxin family PIN domain ribonuclease [Halococcoides cellulosivorans]
MTGQPDTVVFDAEPLVAYFCDEPGSDTVERYVTAVEGAVDGYISAVTLAEVHYVVRAIDGADRADAVVDVLEESGIRRVDTADVWRHAAEFKFHHAPSLGDAFALGTAAQIDGTLLVGADDDFDDIESVPVVRCREESA